MGGGGARQERRQRQRRASPLAPASPSLARSLQDSIGNFYDCKLTLMPATVRVAGGACTRLTSEARPLGSPPLTPTTPTQDPVACPSGYIFSREAILESLLDQKKINKRKLAAWEAQGTDDARRAADKAAIDQEAALLAFDRQNHMGASEQLTKR